jgi:hypothetical protein
MCSLDELKSVQDHFASLEDLDLCSAYVEQRIAFVKEVHEVCYLFVEVNLQMLTR